MIRLGRVYRGMMVQMRATNAKLRRRSAVMVARIAGCDEAAAERALAAADGDLKLAAMLAFGVERPRAEAILAPLRRQPARRPRRGGVGPEARRGRAGRAAVRRARRRTRPAMTAMAAEIAEAPEAAAAFLRESGPLAEVLARDLAGRDFPFAVICGRGSSSHAGVYLRYLIESHLGLVVSASAPSIVTSYRRPPRVAGALFVVISQSGRSPDLVSATRAAREGGALTLALVNDPALAGGAQPPKRSCRSRRARSGRSPRPRPW